MLKVNLFALGILISFFFPAIAEATVAQTDLNRGSKKLMLVQFGTTPTQNQRQQEAFNRSANDYQAWLHYQRQQRELAEYNRQQNELARLERIRQAKESALAAIPELERKGDYLTLAREWNTLEEWDKSLNAIEKAIAANPNIASGYMLRASLRKRLNDIPGTLADYDRAIAINPNYYGYYETRGKLKKSFDRNGAIQDFRMAMKLVRVETRYNLIKDRMLNEIFKELRSLGATE